MDSAGLPPRFVPPAQLERAAREFLERYNADGQTPVPIEEIVEFDLGINIIPMPNLYRDFNVEGWLSIDRRSISIDQRQMEEMETRFRFTLAHEASHLLLHSDLYSQTRLGSLEE